MPREQSEPPTGEVSAQRGAIDTHTHLNHPRLVRRLAQVLARARLAGVGEMIVVGYDLPSSELAVELAEHHRELWAAVGVHPHDAGGIDQDTFGRLRDLARSEAVVAIGETGFDFHRDLSPRESQVAAVQSHLALAWELDLPVILHCRAAQETLLDIVSECRGKPSGGTSKLVWHCFDGTGEHAARALDLGMALGLGGMLTYEKSEGLRRVAAELPADRILLETDCPYLTPQPRRGRDNEPANLAIIAECAARLRGESKHQVEENTSQNARRILRLGKK
ncbi:MAG: TatD family hydrolase [Armatimonadota bacterium]|nr:MAG: TatD family hydrolase [Armatimonadota bacterium]